ncbi:MAG TPA: YggS family pyridoxal phosphate-dependent enzyme [Candidatus Eisenbacteria bacterium]|nr:YggS family pyridoxal phosphate-dependent enzyme [Candidatus Eisenbacteria bacterium]
MGVREKLASVEERMARAAAKSGRARKDITLVAVTKGAGPEAVVEARAAGLTVFGENRVQEAAAKIPACPPEAGVEWHMVGHLQTNKVADAVSLFGLIQSIDSVRVARAVNDAAAAAGKTADVLLEVNISGEPKKYGFKPAEIYAALEAAAGLPAVRVLGLMGLAPLTDDEAARRAAFKELRGLFSVCKSVKKPNLEMRHLSMGMSDDFEAAIEEGSNMVRLGRAIFR